MSEGLRDQLDRILVELAKFYDGSLVLAWRTGVWQGAMTGVLAVLVLKFLFSERKQ